jgi:hypothetical protein
LRLLVESVGICLATANTSLDTQWRDTNTFCERFQYAKNKIAVMRLTHMNHEGGISVTWHGRRVKKLVVLCTSKMIPMENYGVKCMSMRFFMEKDVLVVWKGSMGMTWSQPYPS